MSLLTSRFICGFLLQQHFVVAFCRSHRKNVVHLTPHGTSSTSRQLRSVEDHRRRGRALQTTPKFRASYAGEFLHLRDSFCISEHPTLLLYCFRGNIQVISVSDPSIVCSPVPPSDEDPDWNRIQCINTCTSDCSDIYDNSENSFVSAFSDGPYGQIFFQCEGEAIADIDGAFIYSGEQDGGCASGRGGRNFHLARMGVLCPQTVGDEYDFDDHFFECSSSYAPFPTDVESDEAGHVYTCAAGDNCGGNACEIEYDDVILNADLPRIVDNLCVESLKGDPIVWDMPTTRPAEVNSVFTVQFMGAWGLLLDSSTVTECFDDAAIVRVTCPGSTIAFVSATHDSISCTKTAEDVLECTDSGTSFVNQFAGVAFECVGSTLPKASMEYPPSSAYCDGNAVEAKVSHAVQLGVFCDSSDPIFFFGDYYFDCDDPKDTFDYVNEFAGSDNPVRHTCFQSAVFPPNSVPSQTQVVPLLSISTESKWESDPDGSCYVNATRAPVTSEPTNSPTMPPTAPPKQSTEIPSKPPTNAPTTEAPTTAALTESPIVEPTTPPHAEMLTPAPVVTRSNVGAAVGGAVGATLFVCLLAGIGIAVWWKKRHAPQVAGGTATTAAKSGSENQEDSQTGTETWHHHDNESPTRPGRILPHGAAGGMDHQPRTPPPPVSSPRAEAGRYTAGGGEPRPPAAPYDRPIPQTRRTDNDWANSRPYMPDLPPASRDLPPARMPVIEDETRQYTTRPDRNATARPYRPPPQPTPTPTPPPLHFKDQAQSVVVCAEAVMVPAQVLESERNNNGHRANAANAASAGSHHSSSLATTGSSYSAGTGRRSRPSAEPDGQVSHQQY